MSDFEAFPKIPRLNRPVIVTEKIDGTNACVVIEEDGTVFAQSRKRIIRVGDDNFGFAAWVEQNKDALIAYLGVGRHFGEWWGVGIQRGYGLRERRFSLFNTHRWDWLNKDDGSSYEVDQLHRIGVHCVPVLTTLPSLASKTWIDLALDGLRDMGSVAAPGYDNPEGIVLFHLQSQHIYKVLLENDDIPKGLAS